MKDDIAKHYNELKKKHKLPRFEDIEEFHISDLDDSKFLLAEIRGKIDEKLGSYREFLSEIFNPDTNLTNMYESEIFSEAGKKAAFYIYKRLMFWKRASLEVSVSDDDKANAEFIKIFLAEWKDIKPELSKTIEKVKGSWEKESEETETLRYFG